MVNGRGTLRIIGGQWRGRRLPIAPIPGLRPTPDRVRETLFNWLQPDIAGSHCIDLFAGSGALAFEALSRGASQVIAVDSSPQACEQIKQSAAVLGTDRLTVVCAAVEGYLSSTADISAPPWQIAFVDPPYDLGYPPPQWPLLQNHPNLASEALVYLESHSRYQNDSQSLLNRDPQDDDSWLEQRKKTAGEVCYRLLQRRDPHHQE